MFKSQLEPSAENFVETQIFVENIFDTVKKAREAKAARSLAESKLAHYDYSFDFSPSKRKKVRKNAKNKNPKNGKTKTTPKKKPRKPRTPKDSAEKKKKPPTTPKTPRKYTKRAKVKPPNDIDDEEAAFILSSISQRSFDSFYNRFNGSTQVVNKIEIPLETSTDDQSSMQPQLLITPKKSEPNHLTAYHHVLLDHNYWIVEPPATSPAPVPSTPTSTVVVKDEAQGKLNNESLTSMNLLLTVASHELSSQCTQNSTNGIKVEVNNNKLPLLDISCDTPKLSTMSDDNAVKKRWLRQATTECSTPSPTVTPPETSPNDMKAPLKKRRVVREVEDNNEIKIGVCSETESSKIDQKACFESNNFKNNVEVNKFNNNFVNNSALLKCEPSESVNINLREIHEKIEMEFGSQQKNEQNVVVVKMEPRSVIQSPIGHQIHGTKNNLTYGIQMNSPVDVNAIYGRSQPDNLIKVDQLRSIIGNEGKLPHTQIYDEKLIKIESYERPNDYKNNNVNIVDLKFNDKIPQVFGIKNEICDNIQNAVKLDIYDQKQIKIESPITEKIITVDGKLQQILDGKVQKIYCDNSKFITDQHQKVQNFSQFYNKVDETSNQMSVIQNLEDLSYRNQMENIQKQNHIIIHSGTLNDKKMPESFSDQKVYSIYSENCLEGFPKIHQLSPSKTQLSPSKLNQLKGLSSPTKIQISPTRTYEIYTKNPNENIAESLLKLQQESPVKLIQMSPTKVMHSPNHQIVQALTFDKSNDHGYQKKTEENSANKLNKTQKVIKIKTKTPKVKKPPMKAKKAQQKPKKVKTPKSPSKIGKNKKIDKNLIKNFGNLEDVPLKIRQNLAFEEKVMMKIKDNEVKTQRVSESDAIDSKMSKIHPIVGLIPPFDSKFHQIGGKIMQIDDKIGQNDAHGNEIEVNFDSSKCSHLSDSKTIQNHVEFYKNDVNQQQLYVPQQNDTKLLSHLNKNHGSDETFSKSEKPNDEDLLKNESLISKSKEFNEMSKPENSYNSQLYIRDDISNLHFNDKFTKHSKRTISESSSGSSKTSTCSSNHSKFSKNADDFRRNSTEVIKNSTELLKFQSKKVLKKLKFNDSEKECLKSSNLDGQEVKLRSLIEDSKNILSKDQHLLNQGKDSIASQVNNQNLTTLSNFQVIKDNYANKSKTRTISESSSVSSRTLSCNSPENTPNLSLAHPECLVNSTSVILTPLLVPKVEKIINTLDESQQKSKLHDVKEEPRSSTLASNLSKTAQLSSIKQSKDHSSSDLELNNRILSSSSLKSSTDRVESLSSDTVDSSCVSESKTFSKCEIITNHSELKTKLNFKSSKISDEVSEVSKIFLKSIKSEEPDTKDSEIKPTDIKSVKSIEQISSGNNSSSLTQKIQSVPQNIDNDIIETIIEPPSILKSLSDGIAPIKPNIDSLIPFKSSIETLELIIDTNKSNIDSLSDLKPEKVVEQQVASILEKVIPKTLKTDFKKKIEVEMSKNELETEPIESDNDIDDEDDTPYRECVEEFHKDTIEKLTEANKRFCRDNYVHNPFKHSVSYDERESVRYSKTDDYHSRGSRGYDYDDHRKPLKMSVSFDSHQQYSHHNYPSHYQRSISEVCNDPRKERWSGNGIHENRKYGSFHYDKIHHREPITTTYSMYRAQKASQMDCRWNSRQNYEYQPEPQHKVNSYVPEKPAMAPQPIPQPITPTVINSYRPIQPEPIRIEPLILAISPQAEALKNATSDSFGGFLLETKLNVTSPVTVLPKTKTASHDPRLNPSLVQDVKKEETATPKKKLSLDQYRKRKSLTNVAQISPTDEILPSISVSITESPSPTLSPAYDPTIAAAAATG
ncbi:unnamed protein product [Chironomus riparius]|uniref:Uncharacterized protein n=1 Tax=Chironomus riparius TaxID=315576 RepID=A0A9N9S9V1_9DIPT|nr:unnamed protein product [Chironomus riparius]